jgi:hypothetical protein
MPHATPKQRASRLARAEQLARDALNANAHADDLDADAEERRRAVRV